MSTDPDVESISASLVREYLSRKGLKTTLQMMDEELPRTSNSISNRSSLLKETNMEKLFKKNKDKVTPYRTIIEIMTEYHVNKTNKDKDSSVSYYPQTDIPTYKNTNSTPKRETMVTNNTQPATPPQCSQAVDYLTSKSSRSKTSTDLILDDNVETETILGDGKSGIFNSQIIPDVVSKSRQVRPISSKSRGLSSGPILSNTDDSSRRRAPKSRQVSSKISSIHSDSFHNNHSHSGSSNRHYQHMNTDIELDGRSSRLDNHSSESLLGESLHISKMTPRKPHDTISHLLETAESKTNALNRKAKTNENGMYSVESSSMASDRPASRGSQRKGSLRSHSNFSKMTAKTTVGDIEFGDVDDLESDLNHLDLQSVQLQKPNISNMTNVTCHPIDTQTAISLRSLLFGSALVSFNDEWKNQSLCFCDIPSLQYGIVQKKGGPCGVLAAIQACMLLEMLFSDSKLPSNRCFSPTRQERSQFLATALSKILWRASGKKKPIVALSSGKSHIISSSKYKLDRITEMLNLYSFNNYEDLHDFMQNNISQFEINGNHGVILILYSAILSRGIQKVKNDFDEAGLKLMAQHGYCTQEMVNLLLCGKGVSNVFNDIVELESGGVITVLKGITSRSEIGFLSLFEHYKSCQVGTFYKTPKYPIWVVCSESHFSVLFSTKRELCNDWKAERHFDLYYYDGLANQQEEIKLTIDTTNRSFKAPSDDDLTPPLELCIRTKWPDAEVDWNGFEPIL